MAQDLLVRLAGPIALASGNTTVFTGVTGHTYTIRDIQINNTSGSPVTVSLGLISLASSNLILVPSTIDAGGFATFAGVLILHETEPFLATATATGLVITVNGMDQEL